MARFKLVDTNPQFLSIDLASQLLPGTFEHALSHLLDHEVDLAHVDARFRNDTTGATAATLVRWPLLLRAPNLNKWLTCAEQFRNTRPR